MKKQPRFLRGTIVAGACVVFASIPFLYALGARINTTPSLPLGLYWTVDKPVGKGSVVTVCPPSNAVFQTARERHYIGSSFLCSSGHSYLIKKILAAKNDHISITRKGVYVNGRLVPNSRPLDADPAGRPLPELNLDQAITDDSLLVMGVSAASFDGRYFGLVSAKSVKAVIRPIFTW